MKIMKLIKIYILTKNVKKIPTLLKNVFKEIPMFSSTRKSIIMKLLYLSKILEKLNQVITVKFIGRSQNDPKPIKIFQQQKIYLTNNI